MIGEFECLKDRLYTAQVYDSTVYSDRRYRKKVAAYTTFSLSQFRKCLNGERFAIAPYANPKGDVGISLDVRKDVRRAVIGEKSPPFLDSLKENREHGPCWAAYELYEEMFGRPYTTEWLLDDIFHIASEQRKFERDNANWGLEQLHRVVDQLRDGYTDDEDRRNFQERMAQNFPNPGVLLEYINQLKDRDGVQVVYGDKPSVIEYLKRCSPIPIDDCALRIKAPIPGELVLAAIALGSYETAAFNLTTA